MSRVISNEVVDILGINIVNAVLSCYDRHRDECNNDTYTEIGISSLKGKIYVRFNIQGANKVYTFKSIRDRNCELVVLKTDSSDLVMTSEEYSNI